MRTLKEIRYKIIALVFLCCIFILAGCSSKSANIVEYEVVNTSEYVRDGEKCMAYRVVVDKDSSDEELKNVFMKVSDDSYYLHTIWFYSDKEEAKTDTYTVAMIDETEKGVDLVITRP